MRWTCLLILLLLTGVVVADRLPPEMPENQVFSIDTTISATGIIDESTATDWVVAKEDPLEENNLNASDVISLVVYHDTLKGNGGSVAEAKKFEFDSQSKGSRTYNIEQEKVLSYLSREGSLLTGSERLLMDNTGNYSTSTSTVACVFADEARYLVPAFCNVVEAKSDLININHAKISTKGQIRSAGGFSTPAGLNYRIAVTPDGKSAYAEGTVWTSFAGSIMEARDTNQSDDTWNKTSATNSWKDITRSSGEIRNLQKTFGYRSGLRV